MRFSWSLTGLLSCLSLFTPHFASSQASTSYGLDLQVTIPISAFECLKKEGYTYVISRAWKNTGIFDEGSVKTLSNALAAGFDTLDISFIPCPKCEQSGAEQIKTMMDKLKNHPFGSLWIDIEDGTNWPKDTDTNREFLNGIVNAAIEAVGQERVGIYAVRQYWETLFGTDYHDHQSLPLWTAGFDKRDNFDDWKAFGGWCQPLMKQYDGNVKVCNVHINKNIGKPMSSKTGRWATTCWSKCNGEEQRRKVTCVKGGKDVAESHCRSTRPSAKRSCPFKTPTCSTAGGKCVHRKQCKRYARMGEATCANAPSNVCCDPNAQEPENENENENEEKSTKSEDKPKTKKPKAKKSKPEPESEPETEESSDDISCRVGIKAGTCITQDTCDAKSGESKTGKGYCPKSAGDVVCCYNTAKTTSSSSEENDDTSDQPKPKPKPKLKIPHAPKNVGYDICNTPDGTGVCYPEKDCTRDVDLAVEGYCDRKGQTCCMRRK